MFLTSRWLPWLCVLRTQIVLLPRYEVPHLKYVAWREHCSVWVSGTGHSCLCYSPRKLKARSICTHFEKKACLCDLIIVPIRGQVWLGEQVKFLFVWRFVFYFIFFVSSIKGFDFV